MKIIINEKNEIFDFDSQNDAIPINTAVLISGYVISNNENIDGQ